MSAIVVCLDAACRIIGVDMVCKEVCADLIYRSEVLRH